MSSDHDLLIEMGVKVDAIATTVKRIDGVVGRHDERLRKIEQLCGQLDVRLETVEKRPSPLRWVLALATVQAALNGVFWWLTQ